MTHVPIWFYSLFLVLLWVGIKRCYPRESSIKRLIIAPAVFTFFSVKNTITLLDFTFSGFTLLCIGIILGAVLGNLQVKHQTIRIDKNLQVIYIPGDISMLILIIVFFAIEFFINYSIQAHCTISQTDLFRQSAIIISGIIAGTSVDRSMTYLMKYRRLK